jgi:thiol:disulfide interchange protein DsbG
MRGTQKHPRTPFLRSRIPMTLKFLTLPLAGVLALSLIACSPKEPSADMAAAAPIAIDQAYGAVQAQAKGFTAGAMMSANPVYVLFDPQCPHCGHLWQSAQPLLSRVKFVWVPVAIISAKSLPQGAALLQAADPVQAMSTHEQSLLTGQGGMSASAGIPDEIESAIKANTQLLNQLGADSVPFIVARHLRSGQTVTRAGSMDAPALATFLGVDQP